MNDPAPNVCLRTTGLPKGVEISHYNAVANSTQLLYKRTLRSDDPKSRARKERLDTAGERWLAPLPMYHAYVSARSRHFIYTPSWPTARPLHSNHTDRGDRAKHTTASTRPASAQKSS
jgi:hypothetical protein